MSRTSNADSEIQEEVMNELRWDTRVDETDVGVEVHHGAVTLTGTAKSWAKKLAAQEAAHRVAGVLDVANDVKVKLPGTLQRDDTDIAQAVRRALEWNVLVPDARIRSTVEMGAVTLEGDVDTLERARRRRAGGAQSSWSDGGAQPHRRCSAGEGGERPPPRRLEEALWRHAEREVQHIEVTVRNGVVTLAGKVESWAEKQRVLGVVKGNGRHPIHRRPRQHRGECAKPNVVHFAAAAQCVAGRRRGLSRDGLLRHASLTRFASFLLRVAMCCASALVARPLRRPAASW